MLGYIKDVLTKPMNEGNNVVIEKNREIHVARLSELRKNQVIPERLNFFSMDKKVQNIKFENLHIV